MLQRTTRARRRRESRSAECSSAESSSAGSRSAEPSRPPRIGPGSHWLRALLAVLAGAALTLAFPPYDLWPVAPFAVAALTLLSRGLPARAGAAVGLAGGLGFFLPLLHWTGVYVGPVPWLVLGVVQALYWVPLGAATSLAQRVRGWPVWVAALWVADEAIRMRYPYGGFPWGRLAFSQADAPTARLAALAGAPAVTFAVALAGALLAASVLAVHRWKGGAAPLRRRPLAAAGGALAAAGVVTASGLAVPATPPSGPTVTVAVVQGNVPQLGLEFNAQRRAVLENHVKATHQLAERVRAGTATQPDLVIWPENSSDIDPYLDPVAYADISGAVDDIGVPVLVGAIVERGSTSIENTGIVWSPQTGPGATYVKRHPVPFAEYIPMRSVARVFSSAVDLVTRDMAHGSRVGVLKVGPATVGDVICFEVAYDGLVRDVVTHGGQLIAVQTNNATFGYTPETEQQLAMSRLRAIEHARTVVVSSTSGVSAIVGPDGSVRKRSRIFTAATFVEPVALSTNLTLATRVGPWPEAGVCALAGAALVVAAARSRRRAGDDSGSRSSGSLSSGSLAAGSLSAGGSAPDLAAEPTTAGGTRP